MGSYAAVPAIWHYEVAAVLARNIRLGAVTATQADRFLAELDTYDIRIVREMPPLRNLVTLAYLFQISAYDAACLQLAKSLKLPLATRDSDLAKAALSHGVRTVKV